MTWKNKSYRFHIKLGTSQRYFTIIQRSGLHSILQSGPASQSASQSDSQSARQCMDRVLRLSLLKTCLGNIHSFAIPETRMLYVCLDFLKNITQMQYSKQQEWRVLGSSLPVFRTATTCSQGRAWLKASETLLSPPLFLHFSSKFSD